MHAATLDTDEFVRFRPSVKHTPADREEVRKMLAEATQSATIQVVSGFTGIKPLPPRKCLSIAKPKKLRRTASIEVDALIELAGGVEMLALMMGVKVDSIRRWSVLVPSRHEERCRYIQLNWPAARRALRFLDKTGDLRLAAMRTDMYSDDLRTLLDSLNLSHTYKKFAEED